MPPPHGFVGMKTAYRHQGPRGVISRGDFCTGVCGVRLSFGSRIISDDSAFAKNRGSMIATLLVLSLLLAVEIWWLSEA
jgi:hypothetical protein